MKTMTPAQAFATVMGDRANAERASVPFGIEGQEMDGQLMLLSSKLIPRDMRPSRQVFEEAGFVLGGVAEGIFFEAQFPEGWSVTATDDTRYSKIIDDKGRERCSIFYKAAFYDRNADCTLLTRYAVRSINVGDDYSQFELVAWDNGTRAPLKTFGIADRSNSDLFNQLCSDAATWLAENYPDSKNPLAYW